MAPHSELNKHAYYYFPNHHRKRENFELAKPLGLFTITGPNHKCVKFRSNFYFIPDIINNSVFLDAPPVAQDSPHIAIQNHALYNESKTQMPYWICHKMPCMPAQIKGVPRTTV
jgi:hypothetical protein